MQYVRIGLRDAEGKRRKLQRSRLVYEQVYGKIKDGYQVDHIDDNTFNDNIDNLQALTVQQHCRKTWSNRDNPNLIPPSKRPPIPVIATEINADNTRGDSIRFPSMTAASNTLQLSKTLISNICSATNRCKTTTSKITGRKWTFEKICDNYM